MTRGLIKQLPDQYLSSIISTLLLRLTLSLGILWEFFKSFFFFFWLLRGRFMLALKSKRNIIKYPRCGIEQNQIANNNSNYFD